MQRDFCNGLVERFFDKTLAWLSPADESRSMDWTRQLEEIVGIRSVTGEEAELSQYVLLRAEEAQQGWGLAIERIGDSVLVGPPRREGTVRPLVVLAGHLDTVPIADSVWPPEVREGRLFGRGTSDMKSGVAVMLELMSRRNPSDGFADVAYLYYCGEEGPAAGNDLGKVLEEKSWLQEAGLALLLEPTNGEFELGCQGAMHIRVTFEGKACHSARPWTGLQPWIAAAPWLEEVARHPHRVVEMAGVEFRELVSVTEVVSGQTKNVIPPNVVVNLNVRYAPDRTWEEAETFALSLCPQPRPRVDPEDPYAPRPDEVGVEVGITDHAPAGTLPLESPIYRHLLESTGLRRNAKQAWTDVARFSVYGVPALNWGPGDPLLCHRDDESVEIERLAVVYEAMLRFLSGAGPSVPDRVHT